MINSVYQLVKPKMFTISYETIDMNQSEQIIVRPNYLALCHADQRYYRGRRSAQVLAKKLPMALIHECCATVVFDPTNTYKKGQKVVLIPNQPPKPETDLYENYMVGSHFLSSGYNGFMQEYISLPVDRVVAYDDIEDHIAAITEFVSVACHALKRFADLSHPYKEDVVVWGSGSMAYVTALVVKLLYPQTRLTVVGKNRDKLALFSFADTLKTVDSLDDTFQFDHVFECVGGQGSYDALNAIIRHIRPQGSVILMGVSENEIALNTRDILEKGLLLIGSSRSGRKDFEQAVQLMTDKKVQARLKRIIHEAKPLSSTNDIYTFFEEDLQTPFKTVAKWLL